MEAGLTDYEKAIRDELESDTQKEEAMSEVQKKTGELVEAVPADLPANVDSGASALMRMIEKAMMDPAFDVAKMEHLLAVKERWDATEARKAFVAAKAAFKAEAPKLTKNKQVAFESNKGGARTDYRHTTLDHAADLLSPVLSKHGLAYSWETEQAEGGLIKVTCILTHVLGHSERVTLQAGPDQSGNKNNIQAVGSTVTYLERYTLLSALGMATGDMDTDGVGPVDLISAEQKETLVNLMKEVDADVPKFLKYLGVDNIDQLPAGGFNNAVGALEAKRRAKNEDS